MAGWDESTESEYLAGVDMPVAGYEATLVKITTGEMPSRDKNKPKGTMDVVFIAHWAEPHIKPYVMNKTARKHVKARGITNTNVESFPPMPIRLYQTDAKPGFAEGVGFMVRDFSPAEATRYGTVSEGQPESSVPPQLEEPPAEAPDDVPF